MPISRPRRIFRPTLTLLPSPRVAAVVLAVAVAIGGTGSAILFWHASGSEARQASGGGGDRLDAPPAQVAVVDAGTLKLQNRVVRLLGVDPPPRGEICKASAGTDLDCATAAANAMAAMVLERPVACRLQGQDSRGRAYAVCEVRGTELNRAVVASGWARADQAAPAAMKSEEQNARTARRGLWATERSASR